MPSTKNCNHATTSSDENINPCCVVDVCLSGPGKYRQMVFIDVDDVGVEYHVAVQNGRTSILLGDQVIEKMKDNIGMAEALVIFACKRIISEKASIVRLECGDLEIFDFLSEALPRNVDLQKVTLKGSRYEDLLDVADYLRSKEYVLEGYPYGETNFEQVSYMGKKLLRSCNLKQAEKVTLKNFHVGGTGWAGVDYKNLTVDMHPKNAVFYRESVPCPSYVSSCIQKWVGRCGRTKELVVVTFDEHEELYEFIEQDADIPMQFSEDGSAFFHGEAKRGGKGGIVNIMIARHPDDKRFAIVRMKEIRPHRKGSRVG